MFVRGGSDLGGASLWPEVRTVPVDDTKWRARADFRWSIYLVGRPDGKGETEGVFTLNSWDAARRGAGFRFYLKICKYITLDAGTIRRCAAAWHKMACWSKGALSYTCQQQRRHIHIM